VPGDGPVKASKKQRRSGDAARRLGRAAWRRGMLGVEFAAAAYGGGASPEGDEQPQARVITASPPVPETKDPADLEPIGDVMKELSEGTVLRSLLVTHHVTDTEVWLCAYRAKPSADDDGKTTHVVAACRGTSSLTDAKTDLNFFKADADEDVNQKEVMKRYGDRVGGEAIASISLHSGFFRQYNSVSDRVAAEVQELIKLAGDGPWDVMVAGHSMGGALARLCCFDLLGRGIAKAGTTNLVTIGAGPCGNAAFAKALDKLLELDDDPSRNLHIVNNNDPVPAVALSFTRGGGCACLFSSGGIYVHGGTFAWFGSDPGVLVLLKGLMGGLYRSMARVGTYCCFCRSDVDMAVYDHLTNAYVGTTQEYCKKLGITTAAKVPKE